MNINDTFRHISSRMSEMPTKSRRSRLVDRGVKERLKIHNGLFVSRREVLTFCNRYENKLLTARFFDRSKELSLFSDLFPGSSFFQTEILTRVSVRLAVKSEHPSHTLCMYMSRTDRAGYRAQDGAPTWVSGRGIYTAVHLPLPHLRDIARDTLSSHPL